MTDAPKSKRGFVVLVASMVTAGMIALALLKWWPIAAPVEPAQPAAPPISDSKYLNAAPGVAYIGSEACAKCHAAQHRSYLETPHSRALSDLNPDAEPPDSTFTHAASDRTYRIYRAGGKLHQSEILRDGNGKEIGRIDVPVRYLIGSGNFSRSYLVEIDGFLHESPLTWYASKKKWDMSPGYDAPLHPSFERSVNAGCLVCHAGRFEMESGSLHRAKFVEKAIGCENCHGPGALHQDLHQTRRHQAGAEDLTIVNPGKLPRDLQEAVCSSCHLSAASSVLLRGRGVSDFRPGRPLSDVRTDYRFNDDNAKMTVVGHVEQLRNSVCYQKSDMTCLTCHDPHRREAPKDRIAHHRQQCMSCHETKQCGVAKVEREKKNTDNCVACHMPQKDTEIPHIAFTHHRIGRHGAEPAPARQVPELVAIDDLSRVPLVDRQRNLGHAYAELARESRFGQVFRSRAQANLEAAFEAGLRDGITLHGLAEVYGHANSPKTPAFLEAAIETKDLPVEYQIAITYMIASARIQKREFAWSIPMLEELTRKRRFADDWRLLGVCYLETGETKRAVEALEKSLAIRSSRPSTHLALAEAYRRLGDEARSREHSEIGQWLKKRGHD